MINEILVTYETYKLKIAQMDANGLSMRVPNWERMYVNHIGHLLEELEKAHKEC